MGIDEGGMIVSEIYHLNHDEKTAIAVLFKGFCVGQTVWVIGTKQNYKPCSTCTEGKVTISLDGKDMEIRCPVCGARWADVN